ESQVFRGYEAGTGVTMSWNAPDRDGISAIDQLTVYKRDVNGAWIKVIDRKPADGRNFGSFGTQIEVGSPVDPSTAAAFQYRNVGAPNLIGVGLNKFGDSHWFDGSGLASGNYEYEVWLTEKDHASEKTSSGTFKAKAADTDDKPISAWERPMTWYTRD